MSMSSGAIGAVLNASYASAIMHKLGSSDSSVTVDVSGPSPSRPATVVSLSAEAQQALSSGTIALALIDGSQTRASQTGKWAAFPPAHDSTTGSTADTSALASSTASVEDLENEARASFTDPEAVFKAAVNANGGNFDGLLAFRDDEDQKAFQAAFESGTVVFQNASDVQGLNYSDHTALTGHSEEVHIDYDQNWIQQQETQTDSYSGVLSFPIVGGVYFTYPKLTPGNS